MQAMLASHDFVKAGFLKRDLAQVAPPSSVQSTCPSKRPT
jgi:hypothetical protein